MAWRRFDGSKINVPILVAVEQTLIREKENGNRLKVCIGTDSRVKQKVTEFASVIVFLREKRGGFMFLENYKTFKPLSLRERMITEVAYSVDIAYRLCNVLEQYEVELEVHADINTDPGFQSNVALRDAMGYILSMGFIFKAKPDAFASSSCADRIVN